MVKYIKKILFATDLSKSSIAVFEQAVALASQVNASIVIVHVIEDGSSGKQNRMIHLVDHALYEKNRKESQDNVRNVLIGKQRLIPIIQNALRDLCGKTNDNACGAEHPVLIDSIEVVYGHAAEAIIEIARAADCDMIAMGHNKKGSLLKMLTGSNIGKNIIQESKIPILLVSIME